MRDERDQYLGGGSLPDIVHNSLLVVAEEVLTNIVLFSQRAWVTSTPLARLLAIQQ